MNTRKCSINPYNVVMRVDEMPCRKGVWKFGTLWEHPLGKGEATCHSPSLYSFMHGRLVDNNQLVVVEEICAVDLQFGHSILLVLDLQAFVTF